MSGPKTVTLPQRKTDTVADEQSSSSPDVCCQKIRETAYYKWEAAGCPCGDGIEFWLQAEAELNGHSQPEGEASKS